MQGGLAKRNPPQFVQETADYAISLIRPRKSYSLQAPVLSMPSLTAIAAANVGTGLLTVL